MHKSKIKQMSLAVCLALMPFSGFAAGLGKLNVNSGLGEPLKAEIELLSVSPEELSALVAVIASEEAYAAQGIARLGIHNNIKVEIAKSADGSPILKLRSSQAISDPYLDMLIQVDWASGRLQREYTILLDPPGYKQPIDNVAPMPVAPPSVSMIGNNVPSSNIASPSTIATTQPSIKKIRKLRKSTHQTPTPKNVRPESTSAQELTSKRGDTLSSIAREMQVEGVSLDQMLVGLYENNKEAFTSGNMNRLKVGQIIKVPAKESLISIDTLQAKQTVKVHSANWNAYRNTLAGTVAAAPVKLEAEQKQTASGKIATAEDKAAPVKIGPQDVVKLSAGEKDVGKGGKDASKAFEAKIIALQVEATAREKALTEAQERAAALEKQIQNMQKLLALKSQAMTEVQKNAVVAKVPDAKPETKTEATAATKMQDVPKAEVSAPTAVKPVDNAAIIAPKVNKAVPPTQVQHQPKAQAQPKVQPELSLLEGLMNAVDLTILAAASGVALVGAGWMFLRNKRRKGLDRFERGILTSDGLRANTVFGKSAGGASISDPSFLADFTQNSGGSMIDTSNVDPIAEAELCMAYGRDAQAEEILKDAISKEPKRYELHLKLLEMYAAHKDTSAFEVIATELYTTLGAGDPTWTKVAELGATVEPENPLYDVSKAALATQKLDVSDSTATVLTDTDLDFSFSNEMAANNPPAIEDANTVTQHSFSTAQNTEQDISFDLDSIEGGSTDAVVLESSDTIQSVEDKDADNRLSFNATVDDTLDFDLGDFSLNTEESTTPKAIDNLPALDTVQNAGDNSVSPALDLSAMNENVGSQSTSFDMDFNLPTDVAESGLGQKPEVVFSLLDNISFDLESDAPTQSAVTQSGMDASEISLDLPHSEEPVMDNASIAIPQANEFEANAFDLSSISLNLDEATIEPSTEQPLVEPTQSATAEPEPQNVEIKLDLVAAYIDMDDKEGARELLEEVIKEGGVQQQLRAQKLLASLA